MSSENTIDSPAAYSEAAAVRAREQQFERERLAIERRRAAERTLARAGLEAAPSPKNLREVARHRRTGEFETLVQNERYRERVLQLEREHDEALERIREAEDDARLRSSFELPDDLRLRGEHEKERQLFLLSAGFDRADDLPAALSLEYQRLVERQSAELRRLQSND